MAKGYPPDSQQNQGADHWNVIFLFCISAELTPFVCMYIDSYLPVYDRQLLPKTYIAAVSLVNILIVCILILYFEIWLKQRKITGKAFPKLFPDHTGLLCVTVQLLKNQSGR